ncbi:ABC transporter ATP-binding protein [Testudinibacter sp. TR-2022]|uniref:ABC transporter ATP-binding protein n=1 Tax=Testudinibacter sp. TR-2022 TaxID=2585029 RepID=UPI00111AC71F|nr:ABC transporter ATP-binding protein [Testudinibacter sp. TR-2022]TNH07166.1 ABC transporter ATP-binding protein [Pasteurellaceae bacterium Phil11]TNH21040.1 ABC transporter ATP-binding protein [Testudinibacter sp. TR-2022]TNH27194.1 ABC transporter ATP-binding protein [Testudinibacter sp. TR-2022]
MKSLQINHLQVCYAQQTILQDLNLQIQDDDILCLLGASGCGKTTLLKAIAGLVPLTQGTIVLNQRDLSQVPVEQRKIGMIFQDYALFPHLTVAQNIAFGLGKTPKTAQAEIVAEMAALVQLSAFLQRYPHELSGGQQQRVAIARSLACKPDLLLLDEPFSNIDSQVRYQLIEEMKGILKQQQVSAVFVTHSKEEAFVFADKLALMEQGKIVQFGEPVELYQRPHSRFVADFLGSGSYLPCRLSDPQTLESELGQLRGQSALTLANGQPIDRLKPLFCLLRPQMLQLSITGKPNATIIGRHFLGHTFEYQLKVGEQQLSVYAQDNLAIGRQVRLVAQSDLINLFH